MMRSHLLTNRLEPQDPHNEFPDVEYPERDMPIQVPDTTASAGTEVSTIPEDMWIPLSVDIKTQPEGIQPRVQGLAQFAWYGGDPSVDLPIVILERLEADEWIPVTTMAGREVSDTLPDIITAHTPDPLYPWDAAQTHVWWAAWQPVPHSGNRTGLPLGTYRLHVYGNTYSGTENSWPFTSTEYEIASDPFEVTPATIEIELNDDGIWASIPSPTYGYRLIDLEGDSTGNNPVRDGTLQWVMADGTLVEDDAVGSIIERRTLFTAEIPEDAIGMRIIDPDDNLGTVEFE